MLIQHKPDSGMTQLFRRESILPFAAMFPPHLFHQEPKPAVYSTDLGLPTLEGADQQQQGALVKEAGVGNPSEEQTTPVTMS